MVDKPNADELKTCKDVERQIQDIAALLGEDVEATRASIAEFESLGLVAVDVTLAGGPRYALTSFGKSLGRAILSRLDEEDAANAPGE